MDEDRGTKGRPEMDLVKAGVRHDPGPSLLPWHLSRRPWSLGASVICTVWGGRVGNRIPAPFLSRAETVEENLVSRQAPRWAGRWVDSCHHDSPRAEY